MCELMEIIVVNTNQSQYVISTMEEIVNVVFSGNIIVRSISKCSCMRIHSMFYAMFARSLDPYRTKASIIDDDNKRKQTTNTRYHDVQKLFVMLIMMKMMFLMITTMMGKAQAVRTRYDCPTWLYKFNSHDQLGKCLTVLLIGALLRVS